MAGDLRVAITLDAKGSGMRREIDALRQGLDMVTDAANDADGIMRRIGKNFSDLNEKQLARTRRQIDALIKRYNSLSSQFNGSANTASPISMGSLPDDVGRTASQFNQIGNSVQQLARELPAFTYSASTGFMAISNNLPMLADAISQARRENEALVASGKKGVPVWKQVAKSILSWNTALSVGITLLTVYGADVAKAVSGMLDLGKSADTGATAARQLNDAIAAGTRNAQGELTELRVLYKAATDDTRSREERLEATRKMQKEYPSYFGNLGEEVVMAGNAADAYTRLARNLTDAAIARASMDKMTENASSLIDLNDQKRTLEEQFKYYSEVRDKMMENPMYTSGSGIQVFNQMDSKVRALEGSLKRVNDEIESFNTANDRLASNINVSSLTDSGKSSGSGSSGSLANTDLNTLGGLTNKINELRDAQNRASTDQAINLGKEIQLYQDKLKLMQLTIDNGMTNVANGNTKSIDAPSIGGVDVPSVSIPVSFEISENLRQENLEKMRQQFMSSLTFSVPETTIEGLTMMSDLMGGLSGVVSESAGAWMQWGATLLDTIAKAIPQIIALANAQIMASTQQMVGNTAVAASGAAASVAQIPIVGWVMAIAAVAAMMASLASIPKPKKLAKGGIAYRPTFAMVGEYAGASNNPEVIAPLNKLKAMLEPARPDLGGLYLETKVRGKDLYVVLRGVENERRRTR